jgi:serine/threonine-protein kinase
MAARAEDWRRVTNLIEPGHLTVRPQFCGSLSYNRAHIFMALSPGTRLGPYQITTVLGVGGMGEVYRAHDTASSATLPSRFLPDSFSSDSHRIARFAREAEMLAALNHPNIAALYGVEEGSDARALVMELVEGETLADRIARAPMAIDEVLPIARQIADALECAHGQGVIQRDLKPSNTSD